MLSNLLWGVLYLEFVVRILQLLTNSSLDDHC